MALTKAEIKQYAQGLVLDDRGWNWTQWNDECHRLSVHIKYDQQLIDLEALYLNKLKRLYQAYQDHYDQLRFGVSESFITATPEDAIADMKAMKDKVRRIALKWNTVKAEIRGRSLGQFIRTPVGTTYYIDLDGGNDGSDGLTTGNAWLTLEKYTTVTVRSAGDIAYVRANTDEVISATFNSDEDGTKDSWTSVIGCDSVTNDPWSDSSDVKPILSFGDEAYRWSLSYDDYWWIERLVLKNTTSAIGALSIVNVALCYVKSCDVTDGTYTWGGGIVLDKSFAIIDGCTFKDNVGAGVYVGRGMAWCKNSTFDGGAETTDYGVECFGTVYCEDCDFGQTTAHDKADVRVTAGIALLRNCNLGSAGVIGIGGGVVFEEDADGVKGAQKHTSQNGTVTKDTGVTRSGGADSSAKIEPNTKTGLYNPLTLNGIEANFNFPFKIWTAAALTTITVYIRSLGTWGTYPTASELYIEASYLDHATNATRTTVVSNDVLSDSTSWVAFDVTFTPLQAGFVYLNVYLKKYEASKGCYVDIKPVVT